MENVIENIIKKLKMFLFLVGFALLLIKIQIVEKWEKKLK